VIDIQREQVRRGTGETDAERARRERAARFARDGVLDRSTLVDPRHARAVRGERHDLSAGVGSMTTAETVARRSDEPTAEQRRLDALAPAVRQQVAMGLPLVGAELLARVVREHDRTGRPVPLTREGVATAMAVRSDLAAVAIDALKSRGLVMERRNNFGGVEGYVPALR
jgi:hypothetical protein